MKDRRETNIDDVCFRHGGIGDDIRLFDSSKGLFHSSDMTTFSIHLGEKRAIEGQENERGEYID